MASLSDWMFGRGPLKAAAAAGDAPVAPVQDGDTTYLKDRVDEYMKQQKAAKLIPAKAGKVGTLPVNGAVNTTTPKAILSTPSKGAAKMGMKGYCP